jgi:hypothetical protein
MFKPYSDRVLSTWYLLREILRFSDVHHAGILTAKMAAWREKLTRREFTLTWDQDTTRFDTILFKGYTARHETSQVTGQERLRYDRDAPWEKEIRWYRYFKPTSVAEVPGYYILPATWSEVVERLKINRVEMQPFPTDTTLEVEVRYIEEFTTPERPYNGHYQHSGTTTRTEVQKLRFMEGDYLIPARQKAIEYLVQTLEPGAYDSFFNWNFFDDILFRNEYFSPYIFEETAEKLLEEDPALRRAFRQKKREDEDFAGNAYLQLKFIYEHSPWSEPTYRRYPVFRWNPG